MKEPFLSFLPEDLWCTRISLGFISWDTWLIYTALRPWLSAKQECSCETMDGSDCSLEGIRLVHVIRPCFHRSLGAGLKLFVALLVWMSADLIHSWFNLLWVMLIQPNASRLCRSINGALCACLDKRNSDIPKPGSYVWMFACVNDSYLRKVLRLVQSIVPADNWNIQTAKNRLTSCFCSFMLNQTFLSVSCISRY